MNNFHIYEEVGRGKYSVVYKGRKKKTIEYVAVKSVEKSRRKKVLNEVRIFHNLNHPNILKFYSWYETRNHLWIIFEYCPGQDLYQLIEQDKMLPEPTIKIFANNILLSLNYLHHNSIIYADLKPSNVLISEYMVLKLSDFGQAKKISDITQPEKTSSPTRHPKTGSPYYMAPELFQENGVHSFQSDLWALGCVLYELAVGKPPFYTSSLNNLIQMILENEVPPVADFSPEFNDLLKALLEKDPIKRISWEEIKDHPFFSEVDIVPLKPAPQPQFDNYLASRGINPQHFYQQRANPLAKKLLQMPNEHVDILRISHNVKKNLMDRDPSYGQTPNQEVEKNDVQLNNKDMELNFGDDEVEEEDDHSETIENTSADKEDKIPKEVHLSKEDKIHLSKEDFKYQGVKNETKNRIKTQEQNTMSQGNLKKESLNSTPMGPLNLNKVHSYSNIPVGSSQPVIKNHKPIEQLLIHNSDTSVKPIIGNKEIEKTQEVIFNAQGLPFDAWTPDEVERKIESQQVESHLSEVYNAIIQNTGMNEKLNAISYFETIITGSNVANRLINSAFLNLLVHLLKGVKSSTIKMRICSIIGLMIRHSTVIEPDVAQSGLSDLLVTTIYQESKELVKRKAIASLGEYLFYSATQLDDEQADPIWEITQNAINCLVNCLATKEDEIVKFYACKTIENITAQSVSAGHKFAQVKTAQMTLDLFLTCKKESLKTCGIVTLSHLCKLNPTIFSIVIETLPPNAYCTAMIDQPSRIQQALITMLNLALAGNKNQQLSESLAKEPQFFVAIANMIEHHTIVIRGKAILTISLLIRTDIRWLARFVQKDTKFLTQIDRLSRDNFKYLQYCLLCLLDEIINATPIIMTTIDDKLFNNSTQVNQAFEEEILKRPELRNLKGTLAHVVVIGDLLNTHIIRNKISNPQLIKSLGNWFESIEINSFPTADEFINLLLQIFEALSTNEKVIINHHESIISFLLPALLQKLQSQSADIRFLSLKIFTDIISQYLNNSAIYEGTSTQMSKPSTRQLNDLITKKLLPSFGIILNDNDPVPLFGLKLLGALLECNTCFVASLRQQDLISILLTFYEAGHKRLNRHTIQIVKCIVESDETTLHDLNSFGITDKTSMIIVSMLAKKQDWCFDILLDIISAIIFKINESISMQNTPNPDIIIAIETIMGAFEPSMELVNPYYDTNVVDRASQCLLGILQISQIKGVRLQSQVSISEEHFNFLLPAMKINNRPIQKRILKCIYWALSQTGNQNNLDNNLQLSKDKRVTLQSYLDQEFMNCEDMSLSSTAREIFKLLQHR